MGEIGRPRRRFEVLPEGPARVPAPAAPAPAPVPAPVPATVPGRRGDERDGGR